MAEPTIRISAVRDGELVRDPAYDYVAPLPKQQDRPRGRQCGECGMKFDYGVAYGYSCSSTRCPMGLGAIS